jgi:hypothetical protein
MTTPEPESLAANLFNQIAKLELDEVDQARTLYLALRRLRQQQPGSFLTSVALIMAALKVGRRTEAIDEIGRAYGIKTTADIMGWGALADMSVFVGQLDRGAELYGRLRTIPGALAIPQISINAANTALISGDIESLRYLSEEDKKNNTEISNAKNYLSIIDRSSLAASFNSHQKIVSSVLRDSRNWAGPEIRYEDRDEPTLVIYHWVLGDRPTRNRLQREMLDALRAHYQSIQKDFSLALPVLLNRLLEAPQMVVPLAVAS